MFTKNKKSEFAINIYNKTVEYTREPFFFEKFKLKKEFQSRFEIISIFKSSHKEYRRNNEIRQFQKDFGISIFKNEIIEKSI